MISARFQRRRRALLWAALASVAVHAVLLTLLFWAVAHTFIPRGTKETVTATTTIAIQRPPPSPPAPTPHRHRAHVVVRHEAAPARVPLKELAKIVPIQAPSLPRHPSVPSKIERDQAGFAKEVAQLNKQNDPHAIPTIDPGTQESASKDYAFAVPSSLRGSEHGNGIITPTRHWRDNGRDCYYGRYEFTYPDGSEEDGEIVWPFCYDPGTDPFTQPPHQIPFPFPLVGFKLPPDAQLPPIEKSVYQQWVADPGLSSP